MLTRAEIMITNDIISKVYNVEPFDEMRVQFLKELNDVIPYDTCSFYMASKTEDHILANPVGVGICQSELQRYIDEYEDKDYTKWIFLGANNRVYRESDIFPEGTRENQDSYKDIYVNGGIYYSAQASICTNGIFQGVISLYRDKDKEDFSDKDLFLLELFLTHMGTRITWELDENNHVIKSKAYMTTYEYIEKYDLTRREVEIFGLLMAGIEGDAIADTLAISESTLKKHCSSIYKKLGINSRWELIRFK